MVGQTVTHSKQEIHSAESIWLRLDTLIFTGQFLLHKLQWIQVLFSLFILNDDGYFLASQKEQQNVGRVNPNKFEKPENSNSKLIFVVGLNCWTGKAYFADIN